MHTLIQEYMIASFYFAPRGRERLIYLGEQISHRHLHHADKLIGVVGDAGSGKSSLIKGLFPGLELSNDDDMVNPRKIMQVRDTLDDLHEAATYHIDMQFQLAFTQMFEIVEFVSSVLAKGKRVVVEHFNLLYPMLNRNADMMIGIGGEIVVTRPSVFGPSPDELKRAVNTSLKYRKMAHTAEDTTILLLTKEFGIKRDLFYSSDIHSGFVLRFTEKVELDFERLAKRIDEEFAKNQPVCYYDEDHIMIGSGVTDCTGPRLHVTNTSEIKNFTLIKRFIDDAKTNTYCLVGLINNGEEKLENRNTLTFY